MKKTTSRYDFGFVGGTLNSVAIISVIRKIIDNPYDFSENPKSSRILFLKDLLEYLGSDVIWNGKDDVVTGVWRTYQSMYYDMKDLDVSKMYIDMTLKYGYDQDEITGNIRWLWDICVGHALAIENMMKPVDYDNCIVRYLIP